MHHKFSNNQNERYFCCKKTFFLLPACTVSTKKKLDLDWIFNAIYNLMCTNWVFWKLIRLNFRNKKKDLSHGNKSVSHNNK